MSKAAFNRKKALFINKLGSKAKKKLVKCYILSIEMCVAENSTFRKVAQKYFERFEMLCWRSMEKIS